jgi:hypothetical protein
VRLGAEAGDVGSVADGVVQVGDGDPGGRGQDPAGMLGIVLVAVEAEQGMEVDRAAGLLFGSLAVGDPDRGY